MDPRGVDGLSFYWKSPKTEMRSSPIHGTGLFAQEAIGEGETVIIAGGKVISRGQLEALGKELAHLAQPFPFIGNEFFLVSDQTEQRMNSSMNHSCDPNLVFEGHLVWKAWRGIAVGEELTSDYATFLDLDNCTYIPSCRCGTSSCRKTITLKDWVLPSLREKYGKHFSVPILGRMATMSRHDIVEMVKALKNIDPRGLLDQLGESHG